MPKALNCVLRIARLIMRKSHKNVTVPHSLYYEDITNEEKMLFPFF